MNAGCERAWLGASILALANVGIVLFHRVIDTSIVGTALVPQAGPPARPGRGIVGAILVTLGGAYLGVTAVLTALARVAVRILCGGLWIP